MIRRLVILATALLASAAVLAPAPAHAKTKLRYQYVQPQFDSDFATYVTRRNTPAGRVAPTGSFSFYSPTKSFRMTVNDFAARAGDTVFVWVDWQDGTQFGGCVADGVAREYSGSSPGSVVVRVASEFPGYGSQCSVGPVAGTVTVSL